MFSRYFQAKSQIIISAVFLFTLSCFAVLPVKAISEEELEVYAQNNITFYDPAEPTEWASTNDANKKSILGNFDLLDQIIQDLTTSSSIRLKALSQYYKDTKVNINAPWQFLSSYHHIMFK